MGRTELKDALKIRGIDPAVGTFLLKGNPEAATADGDVVIDKKEVYIDIDRYDDDTWENQLRSGGSLCIPDGIDILRGNYSGNISLIDSVGSRNLISATNFIRSSIIGDFNGNPTLIGNDDGYKGTKTRDNLQADIQPGNAFEVAATEFWTYAFTTFVDTDLGSTFFYTNFLKFQPVGIPADNIVMIRVFEHPNYGEGDQIWQNVSRKQLETGIGGTIDPTTGEIPIVPGFDGPADKTLKISITSIDPITLKCNDALGADVTISSIDEEGRQDSIAAYPFWQPDIDYGIGDILFQNRTFYMANVPGAQLIDFDTNIEKWDQPLSKEEMYRARIAAYLTTNLLLDGTEQVLAFDAEKWKRDITCSSGVFTIQTKGYYQGYVSVHLITTGVASSVVWVERKPSGGSWALIDGSMIKFTGNDDVSGYIPMTGGFELNAGDDVRVKIKKTAGTASLQSASETVALGTIVQPSATITFVRTDNVIPV